MDAVWVVDEFSKRVPREFLVALVKIVRVANVDTLARFADLVRSGQLTRSAAKDLFPHERRARMESGLLSLSNEFPGVRVSTRFNSSGNSHQAISFGPGLLTESFVRHSLRVPRPSRFREKYAAGAVGNVNGQMTFTNISGSFAASPRPTLCEDPGSIYGILTYACIPGQPFTIGYVGIGFPDARCRRYFATINLTNVCQESEARSPSEEIQDHLNLELLTEPDQATAPEDEDRLWRQS